MQLLLKNYRSDYAVMNFDFLDCEVALFRAVKSSTEIFSSHFSLVSDILGIASAWKEKLLSQQNQKLYVSLGHSAIDRFPHVEAKYLIRSTATKLGMNGNRSLETSK